LSSAQATARVAWIVAALALTGAGEPAATSPRSVATAAARPSVALTGWVTDAAHVLDARETARLTARLQRFERETGHQLVVVTVPSLGGQDVKQYTTRLANAWGIGRAKQKDGIVILVAPNERQARIAVGYGLERQLPDAACKQIMEVEMIERFRKGDLGGGVDGGVAAIIRHLR